MMARARGRSESRRRRRLGLVTRLVLLLLTMVLGVAVFAAAFIGTKCYSTAASINARPVTGAPVDLEGYRRPESFTYLTLPEWFIVYSADEYAAFVERNAPGDFPFLASTTQYWGYYGEACGATRGRYPFETGYHVMLGVIGSSFTIEYALKWAYETSVGRLTAWLFTRDTPEDRFAARVAREYGTFMHTTPWYRFPFIARLQQLWREVPLVGPHAGRKWERRLALSVEYAVKGAYGGAIGLASGSAYAPEDERIHARISGAPADVIRHAGVQPVRGAEGQQRLVTLPRYERFTQAALAVVDAGATFVDIAGNDQILMTALAPAAMRTTALRTGEVIASRPILTNPARRRLALRIPVAELHRAVLEMRNAGAVVEHLYDY